MFTANDIQARVRERPFAPFRIVTSSCEAFDIQHPDLIMVGRRYLIIGTASAENPVQFETPSRVAVLHVTALQDLPSPTSSGGNGQQ